MRDFDNEGPDNEFEIEFSDLPTEATHTVSGQLVNHSSQLVMALHKLSGILAYQGTHLLSQTRTWLLAEVPHKRIERSESGNDFELELADLPLDEGPDFAGSLATWAAHLSRKVRLWRLAMIVCTILLMLVLILGDVPSARTWTYNLLAHPTPSPTPGSSGLSSDGFSYSRITILPQESVGDASGNAWSSSVNPGAAPQGQTCSASPIMNTFYSLGVGGNPVWVAGFDGPYATLHLSSDPVPVTAFAGTIGWMAIVQVQVADNYMQPVTLSGSQYNGTPFLFSLIPPQDQLVSITLNPRQPLLPPVTHQIIYQHKTAWNVALYFPNAGCYSLNASWPGGQWHINFTAGL